MNKSIPVVMGLLLILTWAGGAMAQILSLYPSKTITLPTCSATGGTSITVPKGYYEIHVAIEDANVCYADSCATGGMKRVKGNHGPTWIPADTPVSCRSEGATAEVQFVPGGYVR